MSPLFSFDLPQEVKILSAQTRLLQEIRPTRLRGPQGRLPAPASDPLMISGQQHVGYAEPLYALWSRILGKVQQRIDKRVVSGRVFISQYARNKPDDGIQQDEGRQLSSRQDVIPDGDLIRVKQRPHPFIESLVPATDEQQMLVLDQLFGNRLFEGAALRCQEDQVGLLTSTEVGNRIKDRLGFQHHSGATPIRPIIYDSMTVMSIVPKIVN